MSGQTHIYFFEVSGRLFISIFIYFDISFMTTTNRYSNKYEQNINRPFRPFYTSKFFLYNQTSRTYTKIRTSYLTFHLKFQQFLVHSGKYSKVGVIEEKRKKRAIKNEK